MPVKVDQHLPIKFLVPLTKDSARHSAKRYLSNAGAAGSDGGDVLRNQLLGSRFHEHLGANFLKLQRMEVMAKALGKDVLSKPFLGATVRNTNQTYRIESDGDTSVHNVIAIHESMCGRRMLLNREHQNGRVEAGLKAVKFYGSPRCLHHEMQVPEIFEDSARKDCPCMMIGLVRRQESLNVQGAEHQLRKPYVQNFVTQSTNRLGTRRKRTRDFIFDAGQRYSIAFNACRRRKSSVLDPCSIYQSQLTIPNIKLSLEPPWEYLLPCN
jgi:hypothetical protein